MYVLSKFGFNCFLNIYKIFALCPIVFENITFLFLEFCGYYDYLFIVLFDLVDCVQSSYKAFIFVVDRNYDAI